MAIIFIKNDQSHLVALNVVITWGVLVSSTTRQFSTHGLQFVDHSFTRCVFSNSLDVHKEVVGILRADN